MTLCKWRLHKYEHGRIIRVCLRPLQWHPHWSEIISVHTFWLEKVHGQSSPIHSVKSQKAWHVHFPLMVTLFVILFRNLQSVNKVKSSRWTEVSHQAGRRIGICAHWPLPWCDWQPKWIPPSTDVHLHVPIKGTVRMEGLTVWWRERSGEMTSCGQRKSALLLLHMSVRLARPQWLECEQS